MKIGIDASILSYELECGLKTYQRNLLIYLSKIDKVNDYYIFSPGKIEIRLGKNFHFVKLPSWMPIFKRQIAIPLLSRKLNLDVFHFTDVWGSVVRPCKRTIVTLQDLGPKLAYPPIYKNPRYYFLMLLNNIVKHFTLNYADIIIVTSEFIKNEYESRYGKNKRVVVLPIGLPEEFAKNKKILSNKNNSFLAFADFSPRKNIQRVIRAFSQFKKYKENNFRLICICSSDIIIRDILKAAKKYKVDDVIDIKINVSTKKLIDFYKEVDALVYPSLYEGFGLPIIEAMSCGCPVITSNYGSMREISNNAALLVNPKSVNSIYKAMLKVSLDKKYQKNLILSGRKVAKKFNWSVLSKKFIKLYRQILSNPNA